MRSISGSRKFSRKLGPLRRRAIITADDSVSRPDKVFLEHRKNVAGQLRRCRALEKYNRNNKLPRTMRGH